MGRGEPPTSKHNLTEMKLVSTCMQFKEVIELLSHTSVLLHKKSPRPEDVAKTAKNLNKLAATSIITGLNLQFQRRFGSLLLNYLNDLRVSLKVKAIYIFYNIY